MSFGLLVFPLLLALLFLKSYVSSSKSGKNLPPSPPKLPLIGNLHQLGKSAHRSLQSMAHTYGPLMLLHLGTVPVIVASSVEAATEIMKTHDITFANRPVLEMTNKFSYNAKDIAFAPYGEYWRQIRSISVLHLLSNTRVQSYQHVREDEVANMIKEIQGANGSVVNLSELLLKLTYNVICRVALGRTYDERAKFRGTLDRIAEFLVRFSVGSYIPSLSWVDRLSGMLGEADELSKQADEFFEDVVEEHANKKKLDGVDGQDLVDILLELQKDSSTGFRIERYMIKAIITNMFGAGTHTTFTSLEWAVCEILRSPRALKEVQQEVRKIGQGRSMISEEDIHKMPYLTAAVKESLRLHAPAPLLLPRQSSKDVKLMGYDIPAGTQVLINAWAIGRDPSIWEEPEEFRPERFLNTHIDYNGFHFEFLPFGAGRRGCPGISFAVNILELAVANLVYKFDFELYGEESFDVSEGHGVTVHKKFPILIKATSSLDG